MALLHLNFESECLKNNTDLHIILPDKPREKTPAEFYGSGEKYKVLWLLHGTFGDSTDWVRKSNIELYACEKNLVVVMPSMLNANYVNWPTFALGYNAWDYLFQELMPLVYHWFPASDRREDNFIAGLSMGGGGALQYAVGHPEKFAAAAILSSAPQDFKSLDLEHPEEAMLPFMQRTRNSIANAGGLEAYLDSPACVWDKLPALVKSGALPKLYFCCGKEDFLYHRYEAFKAYAGEIGLQATFEEAPGYRHEWRFWDLFIQKALTFFGLDGEAQGNPF